MLLPLSARARPVRCAALADAYRDLLAAAGRPAAARRLRLGCVAAGAPRPPASPGGAVDRGDRPQLRAAVAHEPRPGIVTGTRQGKASVRRPCSPAWARNGGRWGARCCRTEPVFRRVAEDCDAIFCRLAGWSVLAEMTADESASRMAETLGRAACQLHPPGGPREAVAARGSSRPRSPVTAWARSRPRTLQVCSVLRTRSASLRSRPQQTWPVSAPCWRSACRKRRLRRSWRGMASACRWPLRTARPRPRSPATPHA